MPIRKEYRHLYRGPEWAAIRKRILERADNRCERCGKPHMQLVYALRDGSGRWAPWSKDVWNAEIPGPGWKNAKGEWIGAIEADAFPYLTLVKIGVAHLNHDPRDNSDDNLAALCQRCHLKHDAKQHSAEARRTHAARAGQLWLSKDIEGATRPPVPEAEGK